MRPLNEIEKLIKKSHIKAGSDLHQRTINDALQAQAESNKKNSALLQPNIWRIIMKNQITKIAVTAAVVIACVIGMFFWKGTGSGIALADVLARIEQVKAYRFKWSMKLTGEDPNKTYYEQRATSLTSQEHGSKIKIEQLDPNGGESMFREVYFLPQKKTFIVIWPKQKKYRRQELDDAGIERIQKGFFTTDPLAFLKKILKTNYESLGRATIDGIEVEGFQTTDPNWPGNDPNSRVNANKKMWVDVKTRLPVRFDFEAVGDKNHWRIVEHDYQWDVSVDAAEFEPPVIPDDYTTGQPMLQMLPPAD